MLTRNSLLLAAFIAALSSSFAVRAAEEAKAAEDKPAVEKTQKKVAEKKAPRHDHAEANKQATQAPAAAEEASAEAKKPLHDHQKFHK